MAGQRTCCTGSIAAGARTPRMAAQVLISDSDWRSDIPLPLPPRTRPPSRASTPFLAQPPQPPPTAPRITSFGLPIAAVLCTHPNYLIPAIRLDRSSLTSLHYLPKLHPILPQPTNASTPPIPCHSHCSCQHRSHPPSPCTPIQSPPHTASSLTWSQLPCHFAPPTPPTGPTAALNGRPGDRRIPNKRPSFRPRHELLPYRHNQPLPSCERQSRSPSSSHANPRVRPFFLYHVPSSPTVPQPRFRQESLLPQPSPRHPSPSRWSARPPSPCLSYRHPRSAPRHSTPPAFPPRPPPSRPRPGPQRPASHAARQ
jgi:hypothetical protein